MKVIAPWISTVAMNLWVVGYLPKKKKKKGRVGDPDVLEFVGNTILFSTLVIGRLREAALLFVTPWRDCLLLHGLMKCICSKTWPLTCMGWGLASLYRTFQGTVTSLSPRRKQLVFGFRFGNHRQHVAWWAHLGSWSIYLQEKLCFPCALSKDVGLLHDAGF